MSDTQTKKRPRTSRWPLYLAAAVLALGAGFGAVYVNMALQGNGGVPPSQTAERPGTGASQGPLAGFSKGELTSFVARAEPQPVPELTFKDGSGATRTLADWKGKVVLLNLWATWCAPCRKEMPSLDRLQARLGGDGFEVVAVSIDKVGDPGAFLERNGIRSLKLYHDETTKIGTAVKAFGMPTSVLIGRDGRELGRLTGPAEWDSPEALELIEAALSG
ncbi:MAG: TlpA family protein disulfide reductase [Hyphomicrobiales bacterium]